MRVASRSKNSWIARIENIELRELVETHVVNAWAPFMLMQHLAPALRGSSFPDRYVVNVSAMEGSFSKPYKAATHPHTNMAKAAMNMITRTCADDWATHGVYVCSVDTGWVTDENPHRVRERSHHRGFRPPLDATDGAARVYDPIVRGVMGHPVWGVFLKDYRRVDW